MDDTPAWYRGPGMYLATAFDVSDLTWMRGEEIDPIEANRVFIVTVDKNIINVFARLSYHIYMRKILGAEKIDNPSYYDFIVQEPSDLLATTPRLAEFVQFSTIKRFLIGTLVFENPPPDVKPRDMAKIGAMLMWIQQTTYPGGILDELGEIDREVRRRCYRDVELATANTLKMKAFKSLRDTKGMYDEGAARDALPKGLHKEFDFYVASDVHMHASR
jgi:hypothetical protein